MSAVTQEIILRFEADIATQFPSLFQLLVQQFILWIANGAAKALRRSVASILCVQVHSGSYQLRSARKIYTPGLTLAPSRLKAACLRVRNSHIWELQAGWTTDIHFARHSCSSAAAGICFYIFVILLICICNYIYVCFLYDESFHFVSRTAAWTWSLWTSGGPVPEWRALPKGPRPDAGCRMVSLLGSLPGAEGNHSMEDLSSRCSKPWTFDQNNPCKWENWFVFNWFQAVLWKESIGSRLYMNIWHMLTLTLLRPLQSTCSAKLFRR